MTDLLTPAELRALDLTVRLADLVGNEVFSDGPTAEQDWNEFAGRLHAVQHMIMKQAAARAYPSQFRLLGRTIELPDPLYGRCPLCMREDIELVGDRFAVHYTGGGSQCTGPEAMKIDEIVGHIRGCQATQDIGLPCTCNAPGVVDGIAGDAPCKICGTDNRNGTHSALERTGHYSHEYSPSSVHASTSMSREEGRAVAAEHRDLCGDDVEHHDPDEFDWGVACEDCTWSVVCAEEGSR